MELSIYRTQVIPILNSLDTSTMHQAQTLRNPYIQQTLLMCLLRGGLDHRCHREGQYRKRAKLRLTEAGLCLTFPRQFQHQRCLQ